MFWKLCGWGFVFVPAKKRLFRKILQNYGSVRMLLGGGGCGATYRGKLGGAVVSSRKNVAECSGGYPLIFCECDWDVCM